MNVIIANKNKILLNNLNIEVIKTIEGIFTANEIANLFSNFYYNKMIIDVTALKDYKSIETIRELSLSIDMSKVIFLIDDSDEANNSSYLSALVSLGVYNFTRKVDSVGYLVNNPNSYKDVANFHQIGNTAKTQTPKDLGFNSKAKLEKPSLGKRILGFQNVTDSAGSTTLVYQLKKHLETLYKVKAIEINKSDFSYFGDEDLKSLTSTIIENYINDNEEFEVILIDLNGDRGDYCTEVINIIEPGIVKLNKLIRNDNRVFEKLNNKGEKIILNKSVLEKSDVNDFARESDTKIFFNMPNIDDKLSNNKPVVDFLIDLGFSKLDENETSKGIFGIF